MLKEIFFGLLWAIGIVLAGGTLIIIIKSIIAAIFKGKEEK